MQIEITSRAKLPKQRKKRKCPANVTAAYKAYSEAYKAVYGVSLSGFDYDKKTQFIKVENSAAVGLIRLKELTRMLKARVEQ